MKTNDTLMHIIISMLLEMAEISPLPVVGLSSLNTSILALSGSSEKFVIIESISSMLFDVFITLISTLLPS